MINNQIIKNVVVLGSTGNIGVPIIEALIKHPANFVVTAVTRTKSKAKFPPSVKVAESDLSPESLREVFKGQQAIISCVATGLVAKQKEMIDIAIESGVRRFLPSEFGVDTANPAAAEYLPPLAAKVDVIDYLRTKEDKISWTAPIVGSFFDWSLRIGPLFGFDFKNAKATIYDGGETEYDATNVGKIGEAVAAMLAPENLAQSANKYVYVTSFTLTQNRVLAAVESTVGKKFEVTHDTTAGLRNRALERMQKDPKDLSAVLDLIVATIYGQGGVNVYSKKVTGGVWNERLGLKEETLEQTLRNELV